jgi:hypothetical protein
LVLACLFAIEARLVQRIKHRRFGLGSRCA